MRERHVRGDSGVMRSLETIPIEFLPLISDEFPSLQSMFHFDSARLQATDEVLFHNPWEIADQFSSSRGVYEIQAGGERYILKLSRQFSPGKLPFFHPHTWSEHEYQTAVHLFARTIDAGDLVATWERPVGVVSVNEQRKGVLFEFLEGDNGWRITDTIQQIQSGLAGHAEYATLSLPEQETRAFFSYYASEYLYRLIRQNCSDYDNNYMFDVRFMVNPAPNVLVKMSGFDSEYYEIEGEEPADPELETDIRMFSDRSFINQSVFAATFGHPMSEDQKDLFQSYGEQLVRSLL